MLLAAPAAAQITFVPDRGDPVTLTNEQIAEAADVSERTYTIRSDSGEQTTATVSGASLGALLEAADVDLVSVGYLDIARPDGTPLLLSTDQATEDDAFPEGPPVVTAESAEVSFLRPSSGERDANSGDRFSSPSGLTVSLRRGRLLEVSADAEPRRVDPREPVTFTASVPRAGAGQSLTYRWAFNDGGRATGARVTHRFAKRGSYGVVVTVTTPDDAVGVSDVLRVQVGDPKDGPDRQGGGENPDQTAPDSGPGEGAGVGAGGSSAGGSSSSGDTPSADRGRAREDDAAKRERRENPAGALSRSIEGELISTAGVAETPPTSSAPAAARSGREADDGFDVPAAAWSGLAALLLMAAGAALELRAPMARRVAR